MSEALERFKKANLEAEAAMLPPDLAAVHERWMHHDDSDTPNLIEEIVGLRAHGRDHVCCGPCCAYDGKHP